MRQAVGIGLLIPTLLLVGTGCATRNWVREHVGQKEAEIDQRVASRVETVEGRVAGEAQRIDQVEGRVTREAERVEGMGVRVNTLETSVGQVAETARTAHGQAEAAHGRAEAALNRADEVDGRVTRLWTRRHTRDLVDTVHVHFGFDRAELSDAAQTALLAVVKELQDNPNLTLELEGYTDPAGPREYNIQLSQRRVEAVRRFLISQGAEMPRIHAVGLGPITGNGKATREARAQARRVTVKMMVAAE